MDDRKDVEAWADSLLAQHRTAPPGAGDEPTSVADDPMVRLATRLSGEAPDPMMLERLRRRRERFATLGKIDTAVQIVGIVLLCAFAYALFSTF